MKITFQTPSKYLDEKMIFNVLKDYKILNCEVLVRDENGTSFHSLLHCHHRMQQNKQDTNQLPATIDDFIDVIMKDHRKYIRWLAPLSRSLPTPPEQSSSEQSLRLQQNRQRQPRLPGPARSRTLHGRHELRAQPRRARRRRSPVEGTPFDSGLHETVRSPFYIPNLIS